MTVIVYAWEVLPVDSGAVPRLLGVARDPGGARDTAAAALARDDGSFLASVEAVRPSLANPREYQRTGEAWLGRRDRSGGVCWRRWDRHRGMP